jgi:hypothetical protein
LVYSQSVQTHHSFPAILDSISLIEFDNRPYVVHGDVQDSELGLRFRVILESLIWGELGVGAMLLMMRLWGVGYLPVHQLRERREKREEGLTF